MANKVTMNICGQEYTLVADESAAYMENVGALVDEKMRQVLDALHAVSYTHLGRLLFISTTSAASMATSAPAPMAMPVSARVRAGASLMPSPTMATCPAASGGGWRPPCPPAAPRR